MSKYSVRNDKLRFGNAGVKFVESRHAGNTISPIFLVIHYTASGPNSNIANYFKSNDSKVSAHLVIRRDGTVIQCVPFNKRANHAGSSRWRKKNGTLLSGLNRHTIGIELENWGPLSQTGSTWRSWTGASVDNSIVTEATHKNQSSSRGWEVFTSAQMEATIDVARAITEAYGIEQIVGHDDIAPSRKIDPGPAFPMANFRSKVESRDSDDDDIFIVRSSDGLNIRVGPGSGYDKIQNDPLPDGTRVIVHGADGRWREVSALRDGGDDAFVTGWVHGAFLAQS